jgi:hypothetical protein
MGGDRGASGQNSLTIHAARLSNAQPAWMPLWPKDLFFLERIQVGKEMLARIVAMLTKLVERFDPDQYRVSESASSLSASREDDDDDEHENELKILAKKQHFDHA